MTSPVLRIASLLTHFSTEPTVAVIKPAGASQDYPAGHNDDEDPSEVFAELAKELANHEPIRRLRNDVAIPIGRALAMA
jgi:hypothetical protein